MNNNFKLKLIFPCTLPANDAFHQPPYGMGILTAFLRKHAYFVEQEDLSITFDSYINASLFSSKLKYNDKKNFDTFELCEEYGGFLKFFDTEGQLSLIIDKMLASISLEEFDAIGFSVLSYLHFIFALMFAKKIKQKTKTPIIFGGPFISAFGELFHNVFSFVDYMIVGDGTIPLLKLIDFLNNRITISEVPALIYRQNGKLVANPKENYSIESIPAPDFSDLSLNLYKASSLTSLGNELDLPYRISDGCSSRCSFCIHANISDKLRFKSFQKILSELSQMKGEYNCKTFFFCDSTINNSYDYLETLCNLFIKNKLNINWYAYAKIENLDQHILKKMKKAGCIWLFFGVESGSDKILKMMHKGFSSEQASKTLRESSETGLKNLVFLIAGYPHENQEDIEETCEFIRSNQKFIHHTEIFKFRLFYGSSMYFNPEKYGVENLRPTSNIFYFAFDESGGLKWMQKQKQQEDRVKQIKGQVVRI